MWVGAIAGGGGSILVGGARAGGGPQVNKFARQTETDMTENITFPQTTYAGGNNKFEK